MLNWFNMKKKSLPQQVLENTKNIEENTKNIEELNNRELSNITQLNYKQDTENSITYADGKATFKGKMSIIRTLGTQNQVVDSDIEVNISSGDDDIIIDASEDNVSLKIRLDNATRNKINRALLTPLNPPSERQFVMIGTNNAQEMINESEITERTGLTLIRVASENRIETTEETLGSLYDAGSINNLFTINNDNIVVNYNGLLEIDGFIQIYTQTSGTRVYFDIYKNDIQVLPQTYKDFIGRNGYTDQMPIVNNLIEVSQGDILTFRMKTGENYVSLQVNSRIVLRGYKE